MAKPFDSQINSKRETKTSRSKRKRKTRVRCNHTLHLRDEAGIRIGSWVGETTPFGTRFSCKRCGKFFGYQPTGNQQSEIEMSLDPYL